MGDENGKEEEKGRIFLMLERRQDTGREVEGREGKGLGRERRKMGAEKIWIFGGALITQRTPTL